MTLVAYTRGRVVPKNGIISPQKRNHNLAHVPQNGTPYTLCGRHTQELVEVDDEVEIKVCITCVKRLHKMMAANNKYLALLPAGNP